MNTKNKIIIGLAGLLLALSSWLIGFVTKPLSGFIPTSTRANLIGTFREYDFFASSTPGAIPTDTSTSTTANSTSINPYFDVNGRYDNGTLDIRGVKKVQLYVATNGSAKFDIDVTPNGTDWYNFNKLLGSDVSSTATTTVTTGPNNGGATTTVSMKLDNDTFKEMRCNVTEIEDGNHECKAIIEF